MREEEGCVEREDREAKYERGNREKWRSEG